MNTKIYFNNKYIEFISDDLQPAQNQEFIIYDAGYRENPGLKKITQDFLNAENLSSITIKGNNFKEFLKDVKEHFHYIEAAGGFIEKEQEFLFIHRHGRWDLPKGKLEKNETIRNAAVRECEEECGIKNLEIKKQLSSTFHIYPYKKAFALKQSYWFYMTSDYNKTLIPQTEEDIDKVEWFKKEEIQSVILTDTYFTISDVVREALNL